MRYFTRSIASGLATAMLLIATGCNTVSTSRVQYLGGPKLAPTDPAQVQILRTEPTRPHIRLGEIRAEPYSDNVEVSKIEDTFRKQATKLGADAAVVVYDRTQVTGAYVTGPWFGRSVQEIQGRVIVAVAI